VGADLALRCAVKTLPAVANEHAGGSGGGEGGTLQGIAIATCCHHRCDRASYVSSEWLSQVLAKGSKEQGEDVDSASAAPPPNFDLVRLVTSWASCTCASVNASRRTRGPAPPSSVAGGGAGGGGGEGGEGGEGGWGSAEGEEQGAAPMPMDAAQYLPAEEREVLGRKCKRLLDYGRVVWLREQGLHAELVHFCQPHVSLENCLLVAWAQAS
jgi:tRNA:m4X modification enzyme